MIFNQGEKEINKNELKKNALIILVGVALGVMIGIGAALYLGRGSYYGKENLKQAEECFAEERYEDALPYYEKAFHWDYSLADAWLGAAECHIIMGEYEEAFDILEEGKEKLNKNWNVNAKSRSLLFNKQEEIFQRVVDAYLAEDNYQDAYAFVNQWRSKMKAWGMREKLADVKTQVYLAEADSYIQGDDAEEALQIIDEGIEDIDSVSGLFGDEKAFIQKLQRKKLEAYLLWSEHHLSEEDYLSVKQMLEDGKVSAWLEHYLSGEDYVSVRQMLMDGSISIWEEKEAYLQEKVGYTRASVIRSDGTSEVREYNEKKVLTKKTSYDSNGNITTWAEYGDEEAENLISQQARDSQGEKLGNARYYEYDIFGNIIKFTEIEGDKKKTEIYSYDYIYIGE